VMDPHPASQKEQWSSRLAFIVAAIGSAIGLGNIWRFPALCYKYGGSAFFIPYASALILVGIPILFLEIALGQFYQSGDAICFGKMNWRLRGVGLGSVWCGFMVVCYYNVLLSWAIRMFFLSFGSPWGGKSGGDAWAWFVNTVTGMSSVAEDLMPTRVLLENLACSCIVWLTVFFALAFGVRATGRLTYVTVGLPAFLLIVLLLRAVTLEGAADGVQAYIGKRDLPSLIEQGDVWSTAVTQIFFSLSVTFGIMTAYASYNPRNQPAAVDALIIALSNSLFSFIAGFAVFGALGYLAHKQNMEISDLPKVAGPGLMFGTLPVALSTLPGGGHWERLLFIVVLLLGIDSAFSMVEGLLTALRDSQGFSSTPRVYLVAALCVIGCFASTLYCSDTGLLFLDANDFYINFIMLLVGFFETVSVGWVYGFEEQSSRLGSRRPGCLLAVSSLGSATLGILSALLGLQGWGVLVWLCTYALGVGLTVKSLARQDYENIYELFFGNVEELRSMLSSVVGPIPWVWSLLIKHFHPPVLLVLFINLAASRTDSGKLMFGNYEDYPTLYQACGMTMALISLYIVLHGLVFPDSLRALAPSAMEEATCTLKSNSAEREPGAVSRTSDHEETPAHLEDLEEIRIEYASGEDPTRNTIPCTIGKQERCRGDSGTDQEALSSNVERERARPANGSKALCCFFYKCL